MTVDLTRGLRDVLEAAAELATARDEDAVLHIAIRRARQLVGSDLAYVMLLDPDRGDTYMRMAEGATSPRFDTIRLGMGLGLGGQVAEAMAPRWTRNYLADEQYTHVIDPIIVEEGLLAILGVPVRTHGRLTGMLFTSDRTRGTSARTRSPCSHSGRPGLRRPHRRRTSRDRRELDEALDALDTERTRTATLAAAVEIHRRSPGVNGATVPEIVDLLVDIEGGTRPCSTSPTGTWVPAVRRGTAGRPAVAGAGDHHGTGTACRAHHPARGRPRRRRPPIVTGPDHLGYVTFGSRGASHHRHRAGRVAW